MNRDADEPGRAATQILSSAVRRVTSLERRATWAGAVRQSSLMVNGSPVTVNNSGFGITSWTTITSLDLDPGRWVLFGQATVRITGVAPPTVPDLWARVGLRVTWTSQIPDVQTDSRTQAFLVTYGDAGAYSDSVNQVTAVAVSSTSSSTALLQLGASAAPSTSIIHYVYGVTLLAYPG